MRVVFCDDIKEKRNPPSFFGANTTGEAHPDFEGLNTPESNSFCIFWLAKSSSLNPILYDVDELAWSYPSALYGIPLR